MSIPLYDDFAQPLGQFLNYDTFDSGQKTALAGQKHVDLRSFYPGEPWSAGTIGPQSDRSHFPGISLSCTSGTNTTQSIFSPIDLSAFSASDYISIALPALPVGSLTLGSCYLDVSSSSTGSFEASQTDSLQFPTNLTAGDQEVRWPLSLLVNSYRAGIQSIRFRIQATGSTTFRCLAVRCLAQSWQYAPLDQNTLYGGIGATVPPSGSLTQSVAFPRASAPVTPSDWPTLIFSDGGSGPTPVDLEVGAVIQTGANSAANHFQLLLRAVPLENITMGYLDGLNMGQLDRGHQPDAQPAPLEDFVHTKFISVTVDWGTTSGLEISSEGIGYSFSPILAPNSAYYVLVRLVDNSIQVKIYGMTGGTFNAQSLIFDTTRITDSTFVRRRLGRFGWYAQFNEGGTYVQSIRPRMNVYREFRSSILASDTPVDGAQIYVDSTPPIDIGTGWQSTDPTNVSLSLDNLTSNSGRNIKVSCSGTQTDQGITSKLPIRFEDFVNTEITFSLLTPTLNPAIAFSASLVGGGRTIPLAFPAFIPGRWNSLKISLDQIGTYNQTGAYTLVITQKAATKSTWYIDKLSVAHRVVAWAARAGTNLRALQNAPWYQFGDNINNPYNAIMFPRGRLLQVRGQALTPDASLGGYKLIPRYAQLGNLSFVGVKPYSEYMPPPDNVTFTPTISGLSVTLQGSAHSNYPLSPTIAYRWNLGDGSYDVGGTVTHTYETHGSYVITMIASDSLGQQISTNQTVNV